MAAAFQARDLPSSLGLQSGPKLTSGKGVHVVLPFAPEHGWDEIYALSRRLAEAALQRSSAAPSQSQPTRRDRARTARASLYRGWAVKNVRARLRMPTLARLLEL